MGAAWGRGIPIVVILLGIKPREFQSRPGVPVLLKKRNLVGLNDIGKYLTELKSRINERP
jgi:hypothetical protein